MKESRLLHLRRLRSSRWNLFGGLAALNKAATTSLNKDEAVRVHKLRVSRDRRGGLLACIA